MNSSFASSYWDRLDLTNQPALRDTFFNSLRADIVTALNARGYSFTAQNVYFQSTTAYYHYNQETETYDFYFGIRPDGLPRDAFDGSSSDISYIWYDYQVTNVYYATQWGKWRTYHNSQNFLYINNPNYEWCYSNSAWKVVGDYCASADTCETDGIMKVDFMNFILNITNQIPLTLNPNQNQGFCAVDLQPLFDDAFKQQRSDWATAELVKGTLPSSTQKAFKITHLAEYVTLASETSGSGGGTGATDHPVVIVWTLNYDFTSIINLQQFYLDLRTDFATALGIPISRIVIDFVRAQQQSVFHIEAGTAKTEIGLRIVTTTEDGAPTAQALGDALNDQFNNPNSAIYHGTITQNTDRTSLPRINSDLGSSASSLVPSAIFTLFAAFFAFYFSQ